MHRLVVVRQVRRFFRGAMAGANLLSSERQQLLHMANSTDAGVFVFFRRWLCTEAAEFQSAFEAKWPQFVPAYSLKANYGERIIRALSSRSFLFDCSCIAEAEAALHAGVSGSRLHMVRPFFTDTELRFALAQGIMPVLDSTEAIDRVLRLANGQTIRVGLRLKADADSRFGAEVNELAQMIRQIRQRPNAQVAMLHAHSSLGGRSPEALASRARLLAHAFSNLGLAADGTVLNVGGGFKGKLDDLAAAAVGDGYSWDDYALSISQALEQAGFNDRLKLMAEPGAALASSSHAFLCRVMRINADGSAVVNSSNTLVRPTGHQVPLPITVVNADSNGEQKITTVFGVSCMENDRIGTVSTALREGDVLLIGRVGAYTTSLASTFAGLPITVVAEPLDERI